MTQDNFIGYIFNPSRVRSIMRFRVLWGVATLCTIVPLRTVFAEITPKGPSVAECRDRYFLISTNLTFAGKHFWFEIVDNGAHKLEPKYAAECGYTFSAFNPKDLLILRASYLACHVENKGDADFTLRYQIVKLDETGKKITHPSEISCKPTSDWKPREVHCEENYMEVSVRRHIFPPSHTATVEDWGVVLSGETWLSESQVLIRRSNGNISVSVEEARGQGYVVAATPNRIIFRAPYSKPWAETQMVDDIEVELVTAMVTFRQNWVLVMIETTPACVMSEGTFDGSYVDWTVPRVMQPLARSSTQFKDKTILMGVNGQVTDAATMKALDYRLDIAGPYVTLSVPFGAAGGLYESRVIENQYNSQYTVLLYLQHLWADDMFEETEHRSFKLVGTPFIPSVPFTIDQTIYEERAFTVYLGNLPSDVVLVAVTLNGEPFTVAGATLSGYPITEVSNSNGTHAYVIRVPFEDRVVPKVYLGEGILQYSLDINYTLNIMPQEDPYYHLASFVAELKDSFPPDISAVCTQTGIIFKMDHQKLGYLWEITIGEHPLTPDLAAERGYILHNGSQSLTLEVPLFTTGYVYEDINLRQLVASFEVVIRDTKTLKTTETRKKRCPFKTDELIVCAPGGVITVVTSMTATLPPPDPRQTTLLDRTCKPKETDATRALFAFQVNTCGTRVMVDSNFVTYENEVVFKAKLLPANQTVITRDSEFRLTVHCDYPIPDTIRLITNRKFLQEPQVPGVGTIIETGGSPVKSPKQWEMSNLHSGIVRGTLFEEVPHGPVTHNLQLGDLHTSLLFIAAGQMPMPPVGSQSNDLENRNEKMEQGASFRYVPVLGVSIAVLAALLAALVKMKC